MNERDMQLLFWAEFKKADDAYRMGDSITDEQLHMLAYHYRDAYTAMAAVYNPTYGLVIDDLRRRVSELEGFKDARAEHRRLRSPV